MIRRLGRQDGITVTVHLTQFGRLLAQLGLAHAASGRGQPIERVTVTRSKGLKIARAIERLQTAPLHFRCLNGTGCTEVSFNAA